MSEKTKSRLALHGASPAISSESPWPPRDEAIGVALQAAFADGSWGRYHGPHSDRLVDRLAEMHQVKHVLLCSSGTIAVEMALRGLRVGEGDEVILAGYDFSGNFRAIEAVGARPVLVDIRAKTWCLDESMLDEAASDKTKAVLVSHLHGGLAAMSRIRQWADECGVALLEDACQCPGAVVDGRVAGAWGDAGVLSFGGSKLLTAGRGGAVLTSREDVAQRAKVFAERGNHAFPLSEMQAAVLLPQLDRLDERNQRRRRAARRLVSRCQPTCLSPLTNPSDRGEETYFKVAWLFQTDETNEISRETLIAACRAEGVGLDEGFRGFTRRRSNRCRRVGSLDNSQLASQHTVLLHHPVLLESDEVIDAVGDAILKVVRGLRG